MLFAVYPKKHRGVAIVPWTGDAPASFTGAEGRKASAQVMPTGPDKGNSWCPLISTALAMKNIIAGETARSQAEPRDGLLPNWEFKNEYYLGRVRSGTARSRAVRTPQGANDSRWQSRPAATLSAAEGGKPATFEATVQSASLWKGPVADVVESSGSIGTVPVIRRLILYHDLPWFEMEIECDFKNTSIGRFLRRHDEAGDAMADRARTRR